MKIKSIMTTEVHHVSENDSMANAAHLMWSKNCGVLPVINESKKVVGMLTDRDIAMSTYMQGRPPQDISVIDGMSRELFCAKATDEIKQLFELMGSHQIRRVPIVDDNRILLGIVSMNDLALAAGNRWNKELREIDVAGTLASICRHPEGITA